MSNYEITIDTLQGKVAKSPLVSVWRHYPEIDFDADLLLNATIEDYRRFEPDLVKLSPHGRYCVQDFGCDIAKGTTRIGSNGSSSCQRCRVNTKNDWLSLEEIDPLDGHYGELVNFVKKASDEIQDAPIMMTSFSPTMVAQKLSNKNFSNHFFGEDNKDVKAAFEMISKLTTEFIRSCIDAGADGVFIATQEADKEDFPDINQSKRILALNSNFTKEINRKAEFTVLHIHGDDVYLKEALSILRTTAINWHEDTSSHDVIKASEIFKGGLLGGLNPDQILKGYTEDDIKGKRNLIQHLPFILSPSCVVLQGTEVDKIQKIIRAYRAINHSG